MESSVTKLNFSHCDSLQCGLFIADAPHELRTPLT